MAYGYHKIGCDFYRYFSPGRADPARSAHFKNLAARLIHTEVRSRGEMPCLAVASLPFRRYAASVFDQGRPSRIRPTMIEWIGLRQANTPIKITPHKIPAGRRRENPRGLPSFPPSSLRQPSSLSHSSLTELRRASRARKGKRLRPAGRPGPTAGSGGYPKSKFLAAPRSESSA